jgi:hypothetical protein
MTRKLMLSGIVCALVLSLSALAQVPDINPGLWEFTTITEMVGMPNMNIPATTHTQCMTAESLVPQTDAASHECQISEMTVDGGTVSWKIACSGQGGVTEGTGKVTYKGDTMEGTMDMTIAGAGMQVKNTITGKRIGDCREGVPSE